MKKALLLIFLWVFGLVTASFAADIKVGDKVAGFKLKDPMGTEYSLESPLYKDKVVVVFYADPGSKDMNNDLQNTLKSARESGKIDKKYYEGLGIVNLKDSVVPNFVLKSMIKSKQEETKAVILMDPEYAVLNLWSLSKKTSNIVMLDKQRVCRYIYKGKVSKVDIDKVIALIQEYQVK
jgi:predicted transcriptional regulator